MTVTRTIANTHVIMAREKMATKATFFLDDIWTFHSILIGIAMTKSPISAAVLKRFSRYEDLLAKSVRTSTAQLNFKVVC